MTRKMIRKVLRSYLVSSYLKPSDTYTRDGTKDYREKLGVIIVLEKPVTESDGDTIGLHLFICEKERN